MFAIQNKLTKIRPLACQVLGEGDFSLVWRLKILFWTWKCHLQFFILFHVMNPLFAGSTNIGFHRKLKQHCFSLIFNIYIISLLYSLKNERFSITDSEFLRSTVLIKLKQSCDWKSNGGQFVLYLCLYWLSPNKLKANISNTISRLQEEFLIT